MSIREDVVRLYSQGYTCREIEAMVAVAFLSNRLLSQNAILGNGRFFLKAAPDTSFRHTIADLPRRAPFHPQFSEPG